MPKPMIWVTIAILFVTITEVGYSTARPNILLILTDDQGYGDITSHGNPYVKTPVLDQLAKEGARFDRFFVSPVCAPTRASLLTGRYHLRTGVHGVTRGYETIRSEEVTLAECLQLAGYRTGCFGKWHNGRHMPNHPNGQGFEEFIGFCGGHWNTYFDAPLEHNGQPIQSTGFIIDYLTNQATNFIKQDNKEPWFCYLPYNTPHSPWRVPDEYFQRYHNLGLDAKAHCAYAMVENIDTNIGRLLNLLDESGQADNTIVLFLTDNGLNSDRYNAGMKGRKGSHHEGGVRVPLFIRYPQIIPPGLEIPHIAAHIDLLTTLLDFCQIQYAGPFDLDGVSLKPLLIQQKSDWRPRLIFTDTYRSNRGIKLMNGAVRSPRWRATLSKGKWELYDMVKDPGQLTNVAKLHPENLKELSQAFDTWFEGTEANKLGYPSIPVGHFSREKFELPANEANLIPGHGEGIMYSGDTTNGFANCYLHHWTDIKAYPEWTINVLQEGAYDVELLYTCHRNDVGVEMAVELDDQFIKGIVPKAFDPPLVPKPDHVFSFNYQTKASWESLHLGQIQLDKGTWPLRVKISKFARKGVWRPSQGIDLKAVRLTRR